MKQSGIMTAVGLFLIALIMGPALSLKKAGNELVEPPKKGIKIKTIYSC